MADLWDLAQRTRIYVITYRNLILNVQTLSTFSVECCVDIAYA